VRLLPGTYKISTGLTIANGSSLIGAGKGITTLQSAATNAITVASGASNWRICNLSIACPGGAVTGITTAGVANLGIIEHVAVTSATTGYGIQLTNSNCVTIRNCDLGNNGIGILLSFPSNNCQILGNNFNAQAQTGAVGLYISSGIDNTLVQGNAFEGNSLGAGGIACSGTLATTIIGNFFENWTAAAIYANTGVAKSLTIIGNELQATSATSGVVLLNSTGPNDGVTMTGNHFNTLGNAGSCATGVLLGTTVNAYIRGNRSTGASSVIVFGQTTPDYVSVGLPTQTTAPGAGGAGARPATPAGYMSVTVNGTARLIPYY
jgi:hypothetical protein